MTTTAQDAARDTIVVGVDGSARQAVLWAAAEAAGRGARLHAVHVIEPRPGVAGTTSRDARADLDAARRVVPGRVAGWMFDAAIDVDVAVSVLTGDLADHLAREATDAVLLVIGDPDGSRHRRLPAELTARCLCPIVLVAPNGDATSLDGSGSVLTPGVRHART